MWLWQWLTSVTLRLIYWSAPPTTILVVINADRDGNRVQIRTLYSNTTGRITIELLDDASAILSEGESRE